MNALIAETLLRCHRPGREADARTMKAVRFAESDPVLREQLGEQMEFDEQIVDVIHFVRPPDNLRQKLNDHSSSPGAAKKKLRKHMVNPAVLAAVAGVLLILGIIAFFVIDGMAKFPGREAVERMLVLTSRMTGVEFEPLATTAAQLGDWLYIRGYEGYEAPPELAALPVVGSRVFRIEGKPVALAMIERHDSLLYEFHAADFGVQLPPDGAWRVLETDGWVAAIRQRGAHCQMVALRGDKPAMHTFLETLPSE